MSNVISIFRSIYGSKPIINMYFFICINHIYIQKLLYYYIMIKII